METAMSNKARSTSGKFVPKSETPRKIRSVNLTDDAWQWLAAVADKAGVSRNDYLEALAESSRPFMEMVQPKIVPFVETAYADPIPLIEMVQADCNPLIETVQSESESLNQELQDARADYVALLESSTAVTNKLRQELAEVRSQLETERTDRLEAEAQLFELQKNSAPAAPLSQKLTPDATTILSQEKEALKQELTEVRSQLEQEHAAKEETERELSQLKQKLAAARELREAADLLNRLKAKRKKSSATLADIEVILGMLEI
jgi:archaellum component FlaC